MPSEAEKRAMPEATRILPVILLALMSPFRAEAQVPAHRDSVVVRVNAILATLDTFRIERHSTRIWLQRDMPSRGATLVPKRRDLVLTLLQDRYPRARAAEGQAGLFLCPAGVQVQTPGRGCPILDNGVIIKIGPVQFLPNAARISIELIKSHGNFMSVRGHTMTLVREGMTWTVKRVTDRFIT